MNKELYNRHQIRELAMQVLFSLEFDSEINSEVATNRVFVMAHHANDDEPEYIIPTYLNELVQGVQEKKSDIDAYISKNLRNWTIGRIAKIDLTILRLSIFEMLAEQDVPNKVALNEAIEIAKKFSDDRSRKFINGVLSSVIKELD